MSSFYPSIVTAVYDKEAKKYVGILDMRDFVAYVHNLFTKQQPLATRLVLAHYEQYFNPSTDINSSDKI